MQVNITEQLEMIWTLSEIAAHDGHASFKVRGDDLVRKLDCCGFTVDFVNDKPMRLRTRSLDVVLVSSDKKETANDPISASNVIKFPVITTDLNYLRGDEKALITLYREVEHLLPVKALGETIS
ncbi:MAG: hypothetical protein KDJ26_03195 [Alphaproteobacteria bacterium]|jgi:hypothetical protein|nr:hypothetical protein [Alphaproteobacteria bacterium]MCB1550987.1 hypothetical protein [Alphaproteobacteria bacterium]MCB9984200.1 hypothetical protein [Micavibrio sp.]HRK97044.1 hypothetical protein [Alphaproteobacteria bacterium]